MSLTREKLEQAVQIVRRVGVDAWLTFVRETAAAGDPVLPLVLEGGLTWQSALIVFRDGRKVAVVGNFDADPLAASGDWDEVVPYVQGIREPLRAALKDARRIAVNFSRNDVMADGLSHGMYLLLVDDIIEQKELCSAEEIVSELRSVKTNTEIERIRKAIRTTATLFERMGQIARRGMKETELYRLVQSWVDQAGFGYSWDKAGNPIVNFGPDSMFGHGRPSDDIRLADGHILHVDFGIVEEDYSSDIQRCWYVGEAVPDVVGRAFEAVRDAITAGSNVLRPGVMGMEVDAAARNSLTKEGYPEFLHAFGHQVGRVAHDGGGILGPAWDRYGNTPFLPIKENQVYTLELGVLVEGHGYLGLEEMVRVTGDGIEWLSDRQLSLPVLNL